jgi:hypothetical protein
VVCAPGVNELRATGRTEHLFDAIRVGLQSPEYVGGTQGFDEKLTGAPPDTLVVVHQVLDDAGRIDRETERCRIERCRPAVTAAVGQRR